MKKIRFLGAIFAFVLLQADDNIYTLGKVEVTSDRIDSNLTAVVLNKQELKNYNSNTVAQSLRFTPGIQYEPASGQRGEPRFSIRGFSDKQVGIFIDGIPIYSIYDKQTDWSQFSTFNVSEIQISKGYTSPIYGPNTLGGAVNIVTKKPEDKLEISARAQYFSPNGHLEYISVGSAIGKYYAMFAASNMQRDNFVLSDEFKPTFFQPNRNKLNSYYLNRTFSFKTGYIPNENDEYSLNVIYQIGQKGGSPSTKQESNFWKWPAYDEFLTYFLSRTKFSELLSLHTKFFYTHFYNKLEMLGKLQKDGSITGVPKGISRYDDYSIGANLGVNFDFTPKDLLKFALIVQSNNHANIGDGSGIDPNTKQSDITTSVAAEYSREFLQTLRGVFSLSYNRNDVVIAEVKKNNQVVEDAKNSLWGMSAQGMLYYTPLDILELYGVVGKKDNIPTLKDRYSTTWGQRVPNPKLGTENAINYELGINYYPTKKDETKLFLSAFYNDLTNMVLSVNLPNSACLAGERCYELRNVNQGYVWGLETGIFSQIYDFLNIDFSYTFMNKYVKDSPVPHILNFPNHLLKFQIKYSPFAFVDIVAAARFNSFAWTSYSVGSRRSSTTIYVKTPDVFLGDIRLAYRPIKSVELAFGIQNITDRNYWYRYGYELEGRNYYADVSYKF